MSLPSPDEAMNYLAGWQRAQEVYGDPPEPVVAAAILRHMATLGLSGMFVRTLDDDPRMIWSLEIDTGRGKIELRPAEGQSWREYLGTDPECVALGLLPPDLPRDTMGMYDDE